MIVAALLLGSRHLIFYSVFSLLSFLAFGLLQINHVLVYPARKAIDYSDVFDLLVIFAATIAVVTLISSFLRKSQARVKVHVDLLSQSEVRYRELFDSVNLAIFQNSIEGRILAVNPEFARMFAFASPEEVTATVGNASELFADPGRRDEMVRLKAERPETTVFENLYRRWDGTTFLGLLNVRKIFEPRSGTYIFQGFIEDITERRQAEERIRQSLEEKEILLRELFHRTRNNMSVVIALLDMQAESAGDPRLRAALGDTQNRIRSMSLVHDKLFAARDLSHVDLKEYISDLGPLLLDSHSVSPARVAIVPELDSVPVLIESAISCGLILNELITNALRHAFPDGRAGEIRIRLGRAEDGTIKLEVADDGVGVPPGFDFRGSGRTGAQNVFLLVEHQLCGQVSVDSGSGGVAWRIDFRDDKYRARV
jgi:PAS domain S-box-containing protein